MTKSSAKNSRSLAQAGLLPHLLAHPSARRDCILKWVLNQATGCLEINDVLDNFAHGCVQHEWVVTAPMHSIVQRLQRIQPWEKLEHAARGKGHPPKDFVENSMTMAWAGTKEKALRLLQTEGVTVLDLNYESGWQDAIELARLGEKFGVRVEYRGHENTAVGSPATLVVGLSRPEFDVQTEKPFLSVRAEWTASGELESLEAKASRLGDYILAGHLMRERDAEWTE